MSLRVRLISALGANAVTQAVSTVIQLASVPILIRLWGLNAYGYWLLLSAVPAYFSFADAGYVSVAINRMAIFASANQLKRAKRTFHSAIALTLTITSIVGILGVLAVLLLPFDFMKTWDLRLALALLIVNTLISLSVGLVDAVFRASNEYARGIYLINGIRVAEWFGLLLGVFLSRTYAGAAFGMLAGRLTSTAAVVAIAAQRHKTFKWGVGLAAKEEIRVMLGPSLSFMGFPAGNAICLQGLSILVGSVFGPAMLAMFSTYRTMARILVQMTALLSRSLWPEISRLFGVGDIAAMKRIYKNSTALIFGGAVIVSGAIFLAGPFVIQVWTRGAVPWMPAVLGMMLVSVVCGALWQSGMVMLSATNKHSNFAMFYLAACVGSLGVAWATSVRFGIYGVVFAMIALELSLAVYSNISAKRFFQRAENGV